MTNSTYAIASDAEYFAAVDAMRKPDVTGRNSATAWARLTLSSLLFVAVDGTSPFTTETMVANVLAVYAPKTAKGKAGTTKGSLKDAGFAGMSDRLTSIEYVVKNMGIEGVRPVVDGFIASDKGTFETFKGDVKALVQAASPGLKALAEAAALAEAEAEAAKEEALLAAEAATPEAIAAKAIAVAAAIAAKLADMADFIACLTPSEVDANSDNLSAIVASVSAAWATLAPAIAEAA